MTNLVEQTSSSEIVSGKSRTPTLYLAYEAILKGLVNETGATDAVIILADGANETPHILAQAGHELTAGDWAHHLKTESPEIFVQPLASTAGATALLVVYAPGQTRLEPCQQKLLRAAAQSIEYLSRAGDAEIDWEQLVASHRILPVTEEELCRIVLDIHDGPVQKIFTALNHVIHLQHVAKHDAKASTPQSDFESYLKSLGQIGQLLELSLTEIRTFLGAFRPPEFNQRPLLDVLEGLIIQHEALTNATVHFDIETNLPPVTAPVKIALYRILQEALANSVRHAGVDEHFVRLWACQDEICLEVLDFGPGFEPPVLSGPTATERAEHIGLRGMRDRVLLLGGKFELCSQPEQGTRIDVRVPLYG